MIEIVFVLRGAPVAPDDVEDVRERSVLKQIEQSIRDRIGGLSCPEHGAYPRLTATGQRADALDFELSGCCEDLMKRTTTSLS
jgi:hypothetical protein